MIRKDGGDEKDTDVYKILLCWRYLLTRYLALACVVSVMLGVATLIVVNSVMGGFSSKLRKRLHGLLSDVIIESAGLDGFADPKGKMERILADPFLRERVEAMSPAMEVLAMLQFELPNGQLLTRTVFVVGIDPVARSRIGEFREFLTRQRNSEKPSFEVPQEALQRYLMRNPFAEPRPALPVAANPDEPPPPEPPQPQKKVPRGIIVGRLISHVRVKGRTPDEESRELCLLHLGDEVILTTVSGGKVAPVYDTFLVVDYFESQMSEYDSKFVFVPLDYLQRLRAMDDRVTSIQIKLKDYERDAKAVVRRLRQMFPASAGFRVETWEEKQGTLLAAIDIEKGILNVLLFMIVGVAGFGILAIFSMIVAEKTRDIGIMKALGASNLGVMSIFLGYGLLLGTLGALLGTGLGVALTNNINAVERFVSGLTGHEVFNRDVYYFSEIPTEISPVGILAVNLGAVAIAVVFSILPALKAAWLHPVRALRYE